MEVLESRVNLTASVEFPFYEMISRPSSVVFEALLKIRYALPGLSLPSKFVLLFLVIPPCTV
jgi:hypothetical protein